jgi:hypothetical protein
VTNMVNVRVSCDTTCVSAGDGDTHAAAVDTEGNRPRCGRDFKLFVARTRRDFEPKTLPQQYPCDRSTRSTTSLRPFSYRGLPNVAFCVLWHRRSCCANAILDAIRIHGTSSADKSVSRINP